MNFDTITQYLKENAPSITRWAGNGIAGALEMSDKDGAKLGGILLFLFTLIWTSVENYRKNKSIKLGGVPLGPTIVLIGALFLSTGCSSLLPGADPLVVRVEQAEKIAIATFDAYVHLEYNNRDKLASVSGEFVKYADIIRVGADDWLRGVEKALKAYKKLKNADSAAALTAEVANLDQKLSNTQKLIVQIKETTK